MRVLFMGTPGFAAVSLQKLIESQTILNLEILGVVTQPDRPKGRGLGVQPSEVKQVAIEHSLPVWQPEKVDSPDFIGFFRRLRPELVVVVAFGQKIPNAILFEPPFGCINVHGSLLPKYRGAAPIQWSLLNGETTTGVTTMYMDEGWDTGDMIYQASVTVEPDDDFGSLYPRLAELGGDLLIKTIRDIIAGMAPRQPQDHLLATKAPKLKPEIRVIKWNEPASRIHNLVRAFAPEPGAETNLSQERLKIIKTKLMEDATGEQGEPGEILDILKNQGLLVQTGSKPLLITKIQPSGKRVMTAYEYSNGKRLKKGMHFGEM